MTNATKIVIGSDERVALVGKTGSGKTFLARYLAAPIRRLIVLDPKGTLNTWNTVDPEVGLPLLQDGKDARVRVLAPLDGDWESYLETAYNIGNVLVYIDEVYGVVPPGTKPGKWLTALYTRGRELGVGVWAATQRPTWIPLFVLSEAEWLFMFRLQKDRDRKAMAEQMGEGVLERVRDKYGFFVYNAEWDDPIYVPKLEAGGKG